MTDPVDDLLREAGHRWRSAQPGPPEPDPGRWLGPAPSRRWTPSRRWMIPVAAASAAALAMGAVYALVDRPGLVEQPAPADTVSMVEATPGAALPSATNLIVRDGDRVQASGMVVAASGRPIRFCAPATPPAFAPSGDPGIPPCPHGVTVTGVDLGALAGADERAGVRFGTASLRGVWRSGVLTVTQQVAPVPSPPQKFPAPPCPPPAGGWKPTGYVDGKALHQYVVDEHPDQFRQPWVSYPYGAGTPGATTSPNPVEVLVVEVVRGDPDQARQELRRRYRGNLCVVHSPGRASLSDQARIHERAQAAVTELMRDPTNGIYGTGGADTVTVDLVMVTPRLHEEFAKIGLDVVELRPWLRPVT